jgi:hypothetical protein
MTESSPFPPLPLEEWEETKVTLHLFSQIVGKVRLGLTPRINHWWHAPLYLSVRGLTTGPIPHATMSFELEFDLIDHHLVIQTSKNQTSRIALAGLSVARFYNEVLSVLRDFGIDVVILATPFDPKRVKSTLPFERDTVPRAYDLDYANRFWRILVPIDSIFKEFRGRFTGKCSPVHFFWHSFDLAVTRFSGRRAPHRDGMDLVTREAYSHEVISAGFWAGDDSVPEPAFYCYVHPEPEGLREEPLRPGGATWNAQNGSSMALFKYDEFRKSDDPRGALLEFLQSTYQAGARLAGWPRGDLER